MWLGGGRVPERKLQSSPDVADDSRPRFPLRTKLVAIAGIAGTLIGVAGVVVPLVVSAGTRSSSIDTVQVQQDGTAFEPATVVEPLQADLVSQIGGAAIEESDMWTGHYAVPVDADWAELWSLGENGNCYSQRQVDWLEANGVPIPANFLIAVISNNATSGSPATIRNVRLQGLVTPPQEDTVMVTYPECVGDGIPGIYGHITVGLDPVAVYDECYDPNAFGDGVRGCRVGEGDVPPVPGDPLVFQVYPGGLQQLNLSFDQVADFTGRFVADIEVEGQVGVLDLTPSGPDIVSPTVTRPAWLSIGDTDLTECSAGDDVTVFQCTLEQWLAILAAG
jgi:hypothetical protein